MRSLLRPLLLSSPAALVAAVMFAPADAQAGIDACGDIFVEAEAECELVPPGVNCDVRCTPFSVEAACAARLRAECAADCDADASVECTGTCRASCQAECQVDPGDFECRGSCQADCEGGCTSSCADGDTRCRASCQAVCSASCDGRCEGVPPSADCSGRCEASCSGSCEAEANIDCQIECQSAGYVDCQVDVQGDCQTACDLRQGALFCDGQFIDHGDNLVECIESLIELLDIRVVGYANGECNGNSCEGEAGGSISCGVSRDGGSDGAAPAWALVGLAAVAGMARARRRRSGPRGEAG